MPIGAKDIQDLIRLERRYSFMKFTELLMAQSGGVFEATKLAAPCEVNRNTISNYLSILQATFVVNIIRRSARDVQPKLFPPESLRI